MLRKLNFNWLTNDARHFQIFYLGLFLFIGIWKLGWEMEWARYLAIISTALVVQAICLQLTTKNFRSLKSALITALGLCLLLKANSIWVLSLAAGIGISSKFLIRVKNKHVFNPANIGIIAAILLTGEAWISPGQWGSATVLLFLIGVLGFVVLLKVGRLDISLTFLIAFFFLEYCRTILYFGWEWDVLFHKFTNGSFLLFTFFMITDPMTTPNHPKARIIWALVLAALSFALTSWFYIHTAPIWALVILAPATVILDKVLKGKKFQWLDDSSNTVFNKPLKTITS